MKGLTLSSAQAESCRNAGFDVAIMDCRTIRPETFGGFDAVASLGAFEHFCSIQEWAVSIEASISENTLSLSPSFPAI